MNILRINALIESSEIISVITQQEGPVRVTWKIRGDNEAMLKRTKCSEGLGDNDALFTGYY